MDTANFKVYVLLFEIPAASYIKMSGSPTDWKNEPTAITIPSVSTFSPGQAANALIFL